MSERRRWYSIPEAAAYFSIKPKTLYSLAARRRLPERAILKLGRSIRLNIEVIEREGIKNNGDRKRN